MEVKRQDWTLYQTNDDDTGPKLWQIRDSFPEHVAPSSYPVAVVIEWPYADDGLPDSETLATIHGFEALLSALDTDSGNSLLAHIIRGSGVSEMCYYAKSSEQFIEELNGALAGQRRFPIEIEFMDDPEWEYRNSIVQNFAQ